MATGDDLDERPGAVVVSGVVEEGVESGSLLLRGADGRLWQVGGARGLRPGLRVELVGRPAPGLLTTAQQGVPLAVASFRVLPRSD